MRLSSDDGLSRLDFEVCDLELEERPPRIGLDVRVQTGGYGAQQKVWFALTAIERFARELASLGSVPTGAAVLDSLEPGAAQLTILSPGQELGCVVHVTLGSRQKLGVRAYDLQLTGALLLPLAAIRQAVEGFGRWSDPRFLADLKDWGFDEKALRDP